MSAHGAAHMSPAQAAQVAGVSRWAVLRAIKAQRLKAIRDNRNNWLISPEDLASWCAAQGEHTVRNGAAAHPAAQGFDMGELVELRESLARANARADGAERARDQAESDRDHWRAMAERLADAPRRRWWPFG
jgi:excisionase family DNA binding protein